MPLYPNPDPHEHPPRDAVDWLLVAVAVLGLLITMGDCG